MIVEVDKAIIAIVAVGIVLINVGIIYALLTGSAQQQLEIFGRIFRQARRPWSGEDESLKDLRERVQRLTEHDELEDPDG
jgi:hypothetical protein